MLDRLHTYDRRPHPVWWLSWNWLPHMRWGRWSIILLTFEIIAAFERIWFDLLLHLRLQYSVAYMLSFKVDIIQRDIQGRPSGEKTALFGEGGPGGATLKPIFCQSSTLAWKLPQTFSPNQHKRGNQPKESLFILRLKACKGGEKQMVEGKLFLWNQNSVTMFLKIKFWRWNMIWNCCEIWGEDINLVSLGQAVTHLSWLQCSCDLGRPVLHFQIGFLPKKSLAFPLLMVKPWSQYAIKYFYLSIHSNPACWGVGKVIHINSHPMSFLPWCQL